MSTLHHHFRALTALSPLQYQKQLRLVAARERMLVEGLDAASAAFEVGYESASQFNRRCGTLMRVGTPAPQWSATSKPDESFSPDVGYSELIKMPFTGDLSP